MNVDRLRTIFGLVMALGAAHPAAADWAPVNGEFVDLSADESTVWGVKASGEIWRRPVDGAGAWTKIPGGVADLTASGAGWIWAVQADGLIWKCEKPCPADRMGWVRVGGWPTLADPMVQASADAANVWGVSAAGKMWRRPVDDSGEWVAVPGTVSRLSANGEGWVWAVQQDGMTWKCQKPCATNRNAWIRVDGWPTRDDRLVDLSTGAGEVWGVSAAGKIRRRPIDGSGAWTDVASGPTKLAISNAGPVWGVSASGAVFLTNAKTPVGGAQVVFAEAVIAPICPAGKAAAKGGDCIREVFFHREENLSLTDAQARAADTGNALATAAQVKTAWEQLSFDAYAYGRLADGSFAVPVQSDHSNYKRGVNLGATGGNQGFFYVVGCTPGQEVGRLGRCQTKGIASAKGNISLVTLEGPGNPILKQESTKTWAYARKEADGSWLRHEYHEAARDEASISLRDLWGEKTIQIDLVNARITGAGSAAGVSAKIASTSDPANRENWYRWPNIAKTPEGVTAIGFGDDTRPSAQWGSVLQAVDGRWGLRNENGLYIAELTETKRTAQSIELRHPNYSVITIDFPSKTVSVSVIITQADKKLLGGEENGKARMLWTSTGARQSSIGDEENARIAEQEAAANVNRQLTNPLSEKDLNSVMEWIGKQESAATVPYCYRNTSPRDGYEWKIGDPALPNYSGPKARCEAKYGAGMCEQNGAVIYPICKAGHYGDGPLCWQKCPTTQMVLETGQNTKLDCGIGCALNNDVCVKQTADMVLAPINMTLSIITLGLSSGATSASNAALGGAADAAAGVTKVALSDPRWLKLLAALDKAEDIFGKVTDAKDRIEYLIDNVENLETEINRWNADYDTNFASLTSSRIDMIIDQKFPDPDDASYIKQKYGQYKLTTMLESDQWRIWRSVATFAGFEPTGIVATVDVFAQPMCIYKAEPFPVVNILGKTQRGAPDPLIRAQ